MEQVAPDAPGGDGFEQEPSPQADRNMDQLRFSAPALTAPFVFP